MRNAYVRYCFCSFNNGLRKHCHPRAPKGNDAIWRSLGYGLIGRLVCICNNKRAYIENGNQENLSPYHSFLNCISLPINGGGLSHLGTHYITLTRIVHLLCSSLSLLPSPPTPPPPIPRPNEPELSPPSRVRRPELPPTVARCRLVRKIIFLGLSFLPPSTQRTRTPRLREWTWCRPRTAFEASAGRV